MYFRLVVGAKTLPELKKALYDAALAIQVNGGIKLDETQIQSPKEIAEAQLKEEATLQEMYPLTSDEFVDNDAPAPRGIESSLAGAAKYISPVQQGSEMFQQAITDPENQPNQFGLDSKGMPWDGRIHASSKTTNKDGSWRYRRNIDETLINQVEAELRGQSAPPSAPVPTDASIAAPVFQQPVSPAPVAAPVVTPVQNVMTPQPISSVIAPVHAAPTAPATPANNAYEPQIPAMQQVRPAHSLDTFSKNFVQVMGELSRQGKINQQYVSDLCAAFGVKTIFEVMGNPQNMQAIYEHFCNHQLITRV